VSLSVADMARSLHYYQHNIGLRLLQQEETQALLGAGDQPLLALHEQTGARLVRRATGLYHFALRVPSRLELARTLRHLVDSQTPVGGASDHRVSEALYLNDPDGHGIEIYRDRPRSDWYDANGNFFMTTDPLDVPGLLGELEAPAVAAWQGLHPATDMGHIHLQVADVAAARRFYCDLLGFEHMADYPQASFVGAGGYHHHIGMNSWMGAGAPPPPAEAARLLRYEIVLPNAEALAAVRAQLEQAGQELHPESGGFVVRDPSHNLLLVRHA
jgi:catechol 2,3-dioxygenase